MDAENDNDQPNSSSASASVSPSSSNNSSSSNLLGNLPMLPFMRSTDDDDVHDNDEDDGNVNDGDDDDNMHEEPMPLQQSSASSSTAAEAIRGGPNMPPMAQNIEGTSGAVALGGSLVCAEPLTVVTPSTSHHYHQHHSHNHSLSVALLDERRRTSSNPLALLTSSSTISTSNSINTTSTTTIITTTTTTTSSMTASNSNGSPLHVLSSQFLFNNPPSNTMTLQTTHGQHQERQTLTPLFTAPLQPNIQVSVPVITPVLPNPLAFPGLENNPYMQTLPALSSHSSLQSPSSSSLSSSSSSSSASSSSSHQSYRFNLAPYRHPNHAPPQQMLSPNSPLFSSSSSYFYSQQQQQRTSPPAPSTPAQLQAPPLPSNIENALSSSSTPPRENSQPPTERINRNDIADTIDASAVVVQPLEANAASRSSPRPAAANEPEHRAGEAFENDIQLDDNDNNDFDVDLNAQPPEALANVAASTSASTSSTQHRQQRHQTPQQQEQQESLDTSPSGSAGTLGSQPQQQQQQQQLQPPTTLPLLLYQQSQQQQLLVAEESKHLPPSYDHRYHNPRYHHHHHHHHQQQQQHSSNPYHSPGGYPYEFGQKNSNGSTAAATNNNNNNNSSNTSSTMFPSTSGSAERNNGSSSAGADTSAANGSSDPAVDRLKLLYPNVNENETPLPRCWSPHDKCLSIGLSQNNLRVHFKGKQNNDAASVRTAHPIPPACGIYYFEVKIISKGKNGYMGIGLTAQQFRMNRLPGWDKQSYGYHGDDGNSFSSSGHGQSYGPTFTTGDIIGCCVNFVNNTCFYTKNGIHLGIAFRDLPTKLYPTVGLQTPGEEVDANFGQEPFKFDKIEEMMRDMREEMKKTIYDFPLHGDQGDPTTLLQKMVNSYLVHNGYSQTAEAFARTTGQSLREDLSSMRNRQKILKLVMSGRMGQAIEQTLRSYPGLLENNKNLWFMLKCRQFIEMINGSDIEYCPSSSNNKTITTNATTPTTTNKQTTCSAPNQTSVIQSTKSYQNGNTNDITPSPSSSVAATTSAAAISVAVSTSNSSNSTNNTSSNNSSSSNGNNTTNNSNPINVTTAATTATTGSSSSSNNATTTNTNNAQNSSHITVIHTDNDTKTESNLVEHCSASGDAPNTISKNNDNDYLNDVEMENNGHTTNGSVCKNGNSNNFNESIDADEEMDVDVSPSVRKYSHGIERILEFGKDLSQMGQQLEKESKMTDDERQMLEDAFSLIAYSNPWASPLGWQLCPTKRETVCRALNSAILESMSYAKWPPLEYCVAHANELLKVMAQASLGACAFVNIADAFPKN